MGSGRWRWRVAGAAILATACTVDGSSGDFGGVPTASASGPSQTDGDDEDDETEGEQDTESESSGGSSGDTGGSTGMAMTGGSTGMSMGSTGMGSTGMGDDSGLEQPADGMYSECTLPEDCMVATSNVCVTINGGSGFCTNMACVNPVADCDASPGGTAPPICFPVDDTLTSCALDCSAGQICPTGMTCTALADGSICG